MSHSQMHANRKYRSRLDLRGLVRFGVLGRDTDRALIRSLARRLSEDNAEASRLRTMIYEAIAGKLPRKGRILAALRRSSLVGAELDLAHRNEGVQ